MNNLVRLSGQAASLLDVFEGADMPPTAQAVRAAQEVAANAAKAIAAYERFKVTDLAEINRKIEGTIHFYFL